MRPQQRGSRPAKATTAPGSDGGSRVCLASGHEGMAVQELWRGAGRFGGAKFFPHTNSCCSCWSLLRCAAFSVSLKISSHIWVLQSLQASLKPPSPKPD